MTHTLRAPSTFMFSLLWIGALLAVLRVGGPPTAHAQVTFRAELTEEAQNMLDEREEIDAATFHEMLTETLRVSVTEWPPEEYSFDDDGAVEARVIVFVATSDGELKGSFSSAPLELGPEAETMGTSIPREEFLALFGESRFTYGTGSFMVTLDPIPASEVAFEFEDAWRDGGESWTADYEQAWSRAFSDGIVGANTKADGIKGANLKGGREAIGFALVPVLGRYIISNIEENYVQSVAVMSRSADE